MLQVQNTMVKYLGIPNFDSQLLTKRIGFSGTGCDGNNLVVLRIQEGTCTARPAAVGGIWFGLSAAV